jgi:hypothetical protein
MGSPKPVALFICHLYAGKPGKPQENIKPVAFLFDTHLPVYNTG